MELQIIITMIGIGIAGLVSWRFGSLAGTRAAQKFEEKKALKASLIALKALRGSIDLALKISERNRSLGTSGVMTKVPVDVFEVAFVSGSPIHEGSEELVEAANNYLSRAYAVNTIVDRSLNIQFAKGEETKLIGEMQRENVHIPTALSQLQEKLNLEFKRLEAKLDKL